MIFATVGTQLAFPRLMAALNELAPALGERIVAQIGDDQGSYPAIETHSSLAPAMFDRLFSEARVVVAHAGIGTILNARKLGKPLVLMPRRFSLGEHRNDHQLATARHVETVPGVHIAREVDDLRRLLETPDLEAPTYCVSENLDMLIGTVRRFIESAD